MESGALLGAFVRAERLRRGLTQVELAVRIGRSSQSVSNIERGIGDPSRKTLRALARVFEVSIDDLDDLCGEGQAA